MQINISCAELTPLELYQRLAELETLADEYEQREARREKLLASEQQQRQLAEMLYQTSTALSSTLNYEEILDRILEQAREVMPHDAASMMLIDGGVARTFRRRGYASGSFAMLIDISSGIGHH